MLLASRAFSLIKILNSSIFDKIWGFCAEPRESLWQQLKATFIPKPFFFSLQRGKRMGARCRGTDNYLKSLMFGVASAGRGVGPGKLKSRAALCL